MAASGGVGGALDALLKDWNAATAPVDARRVTEASLSLQEDAVLGKLAGRTAKAKGGEDASACRPFDHAAFLARVSSFRIATWFAKPRAIDPFACARHGWRNVKPDLLYCPWCVRESRLSLALLVSWRWLTLAGTWCVRDQLQAVSMLRDRRQAQRSGALNIHPMHTTNTRDVGAHSERLHHLLQGVAKIAKAFAKQLETGHTPLCPWRGNPSPIEFATVSAERPSQSVVSWLTNVLSCWCGHQLPLGTKQSVWESFAARFQKDIEWARSHRSWSDNLLQQFRVSDAAKAKLAKELCAPGDDSTDAREFVKRLMTRVLKASGSSDDATAGAGDDDVDYDVALLLCLLIVSGWAFDESQDANRSVAWCSSCNRRWSLLPSTKSGEDGEGTEARSEADAVDEPARKRAKRERAPPIDLLAQHRPFCPWVHGQCGSDDLNERVPLSALSHLPGWEQYCQVPCVLASRGARKWCSAY